MKLPTPSSLLLIALGLAIPALAARTALTAAGAGYQALTHSDPPENPADPRVEWKEAILWTIVSGALAGLAQLFVRRWLARTRIPAEGYDLKKAIRDAT